MQARVLAMALCLSVTNRCSIKTDERIGLVLALTLLSTYPTLCYKKIQVSTKIRVLPSGTLSRTPELEKILFRHIDRQNVLST